MRIKIVRCHISLDQKNGMKSGTLDWKRMKVMNRIMKMPMRHRCLHRHRFQYRVMCRYLYLSQRIQQVLFRQGNPVSIFSNVVFSVFCLYSFFQSKHSWKKSEKFYENIPVSWNYKLNLIRKNS